MGLVLLAYSVMGATGDVGMQQACLAHPAQLSTFARSKQLILGKGLRHICVPNRVLHGYSSELHMVNAWSSHAADRYMP